jgi:hypothetical protein
MEQIGIIYRDGRDVYMILESEGEVYHFESGAFFQSLTRFARGCRISEIERYQNEQIR